MKEKKKYKIGLIGAGRMGTRWAQIISKSPRATLAFVVDTDSSRAKAVGEKYGAASSGNREDAFARQTDAVFIVTPHAFLYPLAKDALLAGTHVFVEKPGSKTAKEMRGLIRLAKEKKRALMVGFNYRYFDSIQKAKRIIERGGIGTVTALRIVHGHPGRLGYQKEWRMNKRLAGGGVLMDQGLHLIDLALWFFNEPITEISGVLNNRAWHAEVEDAAVLLLQTRKGQMASLSVSISEWKPVFSLHIIGEKGYIALDGLGRKYGDGARLALGRYDQKTKKLKEQIIACNPDADEALRREFAEFISSLHEKQPATNAEDALKVLEIVEAVYAKSP